MREVLQTKELISLGRAPHIRVTADTLKCKTIQQAKRREAAANHRSQTINPSTTATSVVAISRVRRLKRRSFKIVEVHGRAPATVLNVIGSHSGTLIATRQTAPVCFRGPIC